MQPWKRYWIHLLVAVLAVAGSVDSLAGSPGVARAVLAVVSLAAGLYNAVLYGVGWREAREHFDDIVVSALRQGDVDVVAQHATRTFNKAISTEQLREAWSQMTEQLGGLRSAGTPLVMRDLPLEFANGSGHLQLVYTGGAVSGLVMLPGKPTARFGD